MTQLVGRHERSIDGNGRLTLPAKFASQLGDTAYLHDDPEGCVRLFLAADFDALMADQLDKLRAGEITRDDLRATTASTRPVNIDKQGRLTLDDESRALAGIAPGADVVVVGVADSIEIWRPSRAARKADEGRVVVPRRDWGDEEP